jgi:hypothetical protein
MSSGAGYPIEEFLEAITAQLDQTQDALRLKAVNRPLTFALKDFNVDLKVFVEMDASGRVAFRPAAPNEEGASTVSIGFTTITRPMIEENTISMEMAQAPTLGELGLGQDEERRLAKIGVRNGAQLRKLEQDAGDMTLSRHTGVDLERLKRALQMARPRIDAEDDQPGTPPPPPVGPRPPGPRAPGMPSPRPRDPGVDVRPPFTPGIDDVRPDFPERPVPGGAMPHPPGSWQPDRAGPPPGRGPARDPSAGSDLTDRLRARLDEAPRPPALRRMRLRPGQQDLRLRGANLIENGRAPQARLDGRDLPLREVSMQGARFDLPGGAHAGTLEIDLPDGRTEVFSVEIEGQEP